MHFAFYFVSPSSRQPAVLLFLPGMTAVKDDDKKTIRVFGEDENDNGEDESENKDASASDDDSGSASDTEAVSDVDSGGPETSIQETEEAVSDVDGDVDSGGQKTSYQETEEALIQDGYNIDDAENDRAYAPCRYCLASLLVPDNKSKLEATIKDALVDSKDRFTSLLPSIQKIQQVSLPWDRNAVAVILIKIKTIVPQLRDALRPAFPLDEKDLRRVVFTWMLTWIHEFADIPPRSVATQVSLIKALLTQISTTVPSTEIVMTAIAGFVKDNAAGVLAFMTWVFVPALAAAAAWQNATLQRSLASYRESYRQFQSMLKDSTRAAAQPSAQIELHLKTLGITQLDAFRYQLKQIEAKTEPETAAAATAATEIKGSVEIKSESTEFKIDDLDQTRLRQKLENLANYGDDPADSKSIDSRSFETRKTAMSEFPSLLPTNIAAIAYRSDGDLATDNAPHDSALVRNFGKLVVSVLRRAKLLRQDEAKDIDIDLHETDRRLIESVFGRQQIADLSATPKPLGTASKPSLDVSLAPEVKTSNGRLPTAATTYRPLPLTLAAIASGDVSAVTGNLAAVPPVMIGPTALSAEWERYWIQQMDQGGAEMVLTDSIGMVQKVRRKRVFSSAVGNFGINPIYVQSLRTVSEPSHCFVWVFFTHTRTS